MITFMKHVFLLPVPLVAPANVHLSTYQPDGALSVEWGLMSCESFAYIIRYHVNICPAEGHNCTGTPGVHWEEKLSLVYSEL